VCRKAGVISPLLANLYLNALDWAVNDPRQPGQPELVRYADDLVILCAPGQSAELLERLRRWLAARGLELNEQKTRKADSRKGFQFLGFILRWQRSVLSGRWYAHVEPSAKSQQRFRDSVREHLNHWTEHWRTADVVAGLNRSVRGWSGYFHYGQSPRVFGKLRQWMRNRMRRWLWRKHRCTRTLWEDYPDEVLHGHYGLWSLPTTAKWK
jgi:RNA-directed DNA polymerase